MNIINIFKDIYSMKSYVKSRVASTFTVIMQRQGL